MGAFDFSLEDLEIDIDVNADGSDAGDDAAAVQEVQQADEQVEAVLNTFNKAINIIANLDAMRTHINKFKVTPAMLDLHNKNNKLGRAIGMTLPTVESDDEPGDVEGAAADVEVTVVTESIGEKIEAGKKWIIEFFKKIYLALKDFYTKYFGLANRLEKRLKKLKSTVVGKNIARDVFGEYKASLYTWNDFTNMVAACETLLSKPSNFPSSINMNQAGTTGGKIFKDASSIEAVLPNKTALSTIGYEYDIEEDDEVIKSHGILDFKKLTTLNVIPGGDEPTKEHETLDKLGWSFSTIGSAMPRMLDLVKKMKEVVKLEKDLNKLEKDINKGTDAKTQLGKTTTEKGATVALINLTKAVRATVQVQKIAARVAGSLVVTYCSILEKAKVKS